MAEQTTTSIVSVRVNPAERALLEAAATQAQTNLSDFVRRKAVAAAEAEILNRSIVSIPAVDWERFEAWVRRPAAKSAALTELAGLTPTWEQ